MSTYVQVFLFLVITFVAKIIDVNNFYSNVNNTYENILLSYLFVTSV